MLPGSRVIWVLNPLNIFWWAFIVFWVLVLVYSGPGIHLSFNQSPSILDSLCSHSCLVVWSACFFTFLSPCQIHVSVSMSSSCMLACHLFCYFLSYFGGPLSLCIVCGSLSCLRVYLSLVPVSSSFVLVSVSVCVCPVSRVSCVLGFSSTSPVSLFCAWC